MKIRPLLLSLFLPIVITRNTTAQDLSGARLLLNGHGADSVFRQARTVVDGISIYTIEAVRPVGIRSQDMLSLEFDEIKGLEKAVALWRYKPWKSWTKPMALKAAAGMPQEDVQCFYWKTEDGRYGAAVPLSLDGFRTTLGSGNGSWGSKSRYFVDSSWNGRMPVLAVGFGRQPFTLFKKIYAVALQSMGRAGDRVEEKRFPEPFNYIGWCTWNASEMGKKLSEEQVIAGVKTFTDHHFPLGWVLIDDGWFQHRNSQLQSLLPDPKKFPQGFKKMNTRLKQEYGIKYTGVWHALDGYWNAIDPASGLGRQYQEELFSWKEKSLTGPDSSLKTYYFIRPGSDSLQAFYDSWYAYFKQQGFDFTKVDNQLVTERMAADNYPLFYLSEKMHQALYRSSRKYLNGALINCMDMTAEAYFNFGSSAVARAVEDYFPYKPGETYDLQQGNAAAHVVQAIYNALYFSQMVYPDFDMFQSHNPNAGFHAIARALNCGPVYLTDEPGRQDFSILDPLVYHDGRLACSQTPLLPTEDCLFQVQDKRIFKAWSTSGNTGLLGIWNAADTDLAEGHFSAADVPGLEGENFFTYEYFSQKGQLVKKDQVTPISLKRMKYGLYYIIPLKNGIAPIGLSGKYNAPATILQASIEKGSPRSDQAVITLYEGGEFKAYTGRRPAWVAVDGRSVSSWRWEDNILIVQVPSGKGHPVIRISL